MSSKKIKTVGNMPVDKLKSIENRTRRSQKSGLQYISQVPQLETAFNSKEEKLQLEEPDFPGKGMFFHDQYKYAELFKAKSPHAGINSLEEYNKLKNVENRDYRKTMPLSGVQPQVLFTPTKERPLPPHPFKRIHVPVDSPMFKHAISIVKMSILEAKVKKEVATHVLCCDLFWLGQTPRQTTHIFNEKFRRIIDMRNLPKGFFNPKFLPTKEELELPETLNNGEVDIVKLVQFVHQKCSEDSMSLPSTDLPSIAEETSDDISPLGCIRKSHYRLQDIQSSQEEGNLG